MSRSSEEGYAVFRKIANLVVKHPKTLVIVWLVAFVVAGLMNTTWQVSDVITHSTPLPEDTESARAQEIIDAQFPETVAPSTAAIVVVADDVTSATYRRFVADLNDAIVAASGLESGEQATLTLRNRQTITLDRPVEYLSDPSEATIYGVYAAYAYELAREFVGPVHQQVLFTQTATGIYWGWPAFFLGVWSSVPPPFQNQTAYAATHANVTALPVDVQAWANASFETWYQGWNASWSNASMMFFPPDVRADVVVAQTLPGFLSSPLAMAMFPAEQRYFQLGLLGTFNLSNFGNASMIESYALAAFPPTGVAELPFFEDVYRDLDEGATDEQLRGFAANESLAYGVWDTPLTFPVNVSRFFVGADGTIMLMSYSFSEDVLFVDAQGNTPVREDVYVIRDIVAAVKGAYGAGASEAAVHVTGSAPLEVDQEILVEDRAEFIATIVLIVVLIGLYFRSVVSPGLPILTIGVAILISNLFIYFIAVHVFELHFTVTAVLQTVLLAVGTDYSIFLVSRYRDERRGGKDVKEAVRISVVWAGESVATSGGAVLISFAALTLGSFPIVQGIGITTGLAVTVALALALTFIPALLLLAGDRVFWPSGRKAPPKRKEGEHTRSERYFAGAASFSMRHAKAIVLVAVLVTIPTAYVVVGYRPNFDLMEGMPSTESTRGIDSIGSAFGEGFLFPTVLVVQFDTPVLLPDGNVSVAKLDALEALKDGILAREAEVRSVEGPTNPQGTAIDYRNLSAMPPPQRAAFVAAMKPFIGEDNRTVRLSLVLGLPAMSREAVDAIDRLGNVAADVRADEPELQDASLYLGGVSAVLNDLRDSTNRDFLLMGVLVLTGLFLVLLFVLGSVLIPLRAILTIALSVVWTLGLSILVFQAWLGLDPIFILPLILFVMAMGLGMDYDIFIITRVREEVARGATDREAIARAVTRTGGIISACGIVMGGAFLTLIISPLPFLKEIGFTLAFAILLDATIVRIYLVPAIMVLAGKYNWWAPGGLQRVRLDEKKAAKEKARGKPPAP